MSEKFEQEIKRTKGHELLWAYSQGGIPKPGAEMNGTDMLRAVGNALIELGNIDLRNHPPEAMIRMIETLATVVFMLHTEANLLRKDHGLPNLSVEDILEESRHV